MYYVRQAFMGFTVQLLSTCDRQTCRLLRTSSMLCAINSHLSSSLRNLATLLDTGKELSQISLEEVSLHDNCDDCWIILFDNVYDITEFVQQHPGGETILLENAGRDATFVFFSAGHGAEEMGRLDKYLVGRLPDHQKLFTCKDL